MFHLDSELVLRLQKISVYPLSHYRHHRPRTRRHRRIQMEHTTAVPDTSRHVMTSDQGQAPLVWIDCEVTAFLPGFVSPAPLQINTMVKLTTLLDDLDDGAEPRFGRNY